MFTCPFPQLIIGALLLVATGTTGLAQPAGELKRFPVKEAKQGVAVDAGFFYVINDHSITRHRKSDGRQVAAWDGGVEGSIRHLNGGVVIEGRLYCTNSNYPESPMASSVEIFEAETLRHVGNHSFGIFAGSATWLDRRDGYWWVAFAHYTGKGSSEGKDNRWTVLIKFDGEWRQTESWLFPKTLIEAFAPKSNSGGSWGKDGLLYCTGHNKPELYVLRLPRMGFTLEHVKTIPVPFPGQGIALEEEAGKRRVYGIDRSQNAVIVAEIE